MHFTYAYEVLAYLLRIHTYMAYLYTYMHCTYACIHLYVRYAKKMYQCLSHVHIYVYVHTDMYMYLIRYVCYTCTYICQVRQEDGARQAIKRQRSDSTRYEVLAYVAYEVQAYVASEVLAYVASEVLACVADEVLYLMHE